MNSLLVEFLLPSVIVTLFSIAILTAVLRSGAFHSLLGIAAMGWAVILLLAEISARSGSADGIAMALILAFLVSLQAIAGVFLLRRRSS